MNFNVSIRRFLHSCIAYTIKKIDMVVTVRVEILFYIMFLLL